MLPENPMAAITIRNRKMQARYFLKYNYTTVQDGMAYAYAKVKNGDNLEVRVR